MFACCCFLIGGVSVEMAHSSHSERSIHEMLKDTPPMNESNSAIHSGIEGRIKHPNSLPFRNNSGLFKKKLIFQIYTSIYEQCYEYEYECNMFFSSSHTTHIPIQW